MPKITVTLTAQQIIEKFMDEGDVADSIMEYSPDFGFPDNTDLDSVSFNEVTYDVNGNAIFTFDYEVEEDEDEDEDDDFDPED